MSRCRQRDRPYSAKEFLTGHDQAENLEGGLLLLADADLFEAGGQAGRQFRGVTANPLARITALQGTQIEHDNPGSTPKCGEGVHVILHWTACREG